jgi:hypothetical protein
MEHVTLPALDESGTRVETREVLEVEREAPNRVRLMHSPAFVAGLARGDLVELDPSLLTGFRVIERGGMIAAVFAFRTTQQRKEAEQQLSIEIQGIGGICEGGPGLALVFSIPAGAGFPAVEGFLNDILRRFPGGGWYLGNVHGADGEPLNWWE